MVFFLTAINIVFPGKYLTFLINYNEYIVQDLEYLQTTSTEIGEHAKC